MSLSYDRERSYIVEQNLKRMGVGTSYSGAIYKTDNLDMFRSLNGNRRIRPLKVERLKRLIKDFGYKEYSPIVVNERYEVIDGQHRLEACRQLGCGITYTVAQGAEIGDCQILNQSATNWVMEDFVLSYAANGNVNYERLIDIYNPRLPWQGFNILLQICGYAGARGSSTGAARNGNLELSEFTANRVRWAYDFIIDHVDDIRSVKGRTDKFAEAIAFALLNTNCDPKRMGKLLRERLYLVGVIGDMPTAIEAVEKLYNYRLRNGFVDICGIWKNWKYYSKRAK